MNPSPPKIEKQNKRIQKELHLLANLPKDYKVGKRDTALGILLHVRTLALLTARHAHFRQVEIAAQIVKSQFLDNKIEKLFFDIIVTDSFPFQAPQIICKTKVSPSSCLASPRPAVLLPVARGRPRRARGGAAQGVGPQHDDLRDHPADP